MKNAATSSGGCESKLPNPDQRERLEYIDALRGIAILGVVVVHAALLTSQPGHIFEVAFTGQRGVQLFYMVSAFTLYLSLDSPRKEHHRLSNFYIRRFFRIAPLFYFAIFTNMLLYELKPPYSPLRNLGLFRVVLGFLFLHGASPKAINSVAIGGWSVAVESSFYLVLPLLHRYCNNLRRAVVLFAGTALVLGPLCAWLARRTGSPESFLGQYYGFLWFPAEFPVFALGILAYYIWREYIPYIRGNRDISLLLLLGSGLIFWGCLPFTDRHLYASSLLFLTLILALAIHPWSLFVNRFTRFLGKISYSLYLLHFFVVLALGSVVFRLGHYPISRQIIGRPLGLALATVVLLGISVLICTLTWRFIEEPGINLGRRWIRQRECAHILVVQVPDRQTVACPSCEKTHSPLALQLPVGAVAGPVSEGAVTAPLEDT